MRPQIFVECLRVFFISILVPCDHRIRSHKKCKTKLNFGKRRRRRKGETDGREQRRRQAHRPQQGGGDRQERDHHDRLGPAHGRDARVRRRRRRQRGGGPRVRVLLLGSHRRLHDGPGRDGPGLPGHQEAGQHGAEALAEGRS